MRLGMRFGFAALALLAVSCATVQAPPAGTEKLSPANTARSPRMQASSLTSRMGCPEAKICPPPMDHTLSPCFKAVLGAVTQGQRA